MADGERFDIVKFFTGFVNPVTWGKTIVYLVISIVIIFIFICVKDFFFPTKAITNKPRALVIGKAEKGAIDQTSTNIVVTEKDWEVGAGGGVLRYDNKDGWIAGVMVKKKF